MPLSLSDQANVWIIFWIVHDNLSFNWLGVLPLVRHFAIKISGYTKALLRCFHFSNYHQYNYHYHYCTLHCYCVPATKQPEPITFTAGAPQLRAKQYMSKQRRVRGKVSCPIRQTRCAK